MSFNIHKTLNAFGFNETEVLLVVPPFSLIDMPCIGLNILRTIANSMDVKTSVLYANMLFAKYIGIENYQRICRALMSMHTMLGERIFANAAHASMPVLGVDFCNHYDDNFNDMFFELSSVEEMTSMANMANKWSDILADEISNRGFKIVGIITGHQQTNATISLVNGIKRRNKGVICVIGGSACDGDMAEGVLTLCPNADYVFSGESETTWEEFLIKYRNDDLPKDRIIKGGRLSNLDEIVCDENTYSDYFHQLNCLDIIKEKDVSLLYESSRGCWWGERNKCAFCGVNGWERHYRHKSEQKVYDELTIMLKTHPEVKRIQMVDTLMPRKYLNRLVPSIKKAFPYISLFYEQRADLTIQQVTKLKLCGIHYTQVGIEALSTNLLKLVNKGVDAEQNIKFLRYSKSVGLLIGWNLLTEIPNDRMEDWSDVLELIPMIYHLNPPLLIRPLEIVRFSPYFEHPEAFGVQNITPNTVYSEIFPESADIEKVAWLFNADYKSSSKENGKLNRRIKIEVQKWMDSWKHGRTNIPTLNVSKANDGYYLEDSRFGQLTRERITPSEAKVALFGATEDNKDQFNWGKSKKVIYYYEGKYLPLATANPKIFEELENE